MIPRIAASTAKSISISATREGTEIHAQFCGSAKESSECVDAFTLLFLAWSQDAALNIVLYEWKCQLQEA